MHHLKNIYTCIAQYSHSDQWVLPSSNQFHCEPLHAALSSSSGLHSSLQVTTAPVNMHHCINSVCILGKCHSWSQACVCLKPPWQQWQSSCTTVRERTDTSLCFKIGYVGNTSAVILSLTVSLYFSFHLSTITALIWQMVLTVGFTPLGQSLAHHCYISFVLFIAKAACLYST